MLREARIASLYKRDEEMDCRTSDENEEIKALYRDFYGEPLSELAEELLHTSYTDRRSDLFLLYNVLPLLHLDFLNCVT